MNKETFLDTLRDQYREEIREAFLESEHHHHEVVDYKALNSKLNRLLKTSKIDGLPRGDFEELLKSSLPAVVLTHIDLLSRSKSKRAA